MTPEQLQGLINWVAVNVMGWELYHGSFYGNANYAAIRKDDFRPHLPNGQIEMVIDKMLQDGWKLELFCWPHTDPTAVFRKCDGSYGNVPEVRASNQCRRIAIMLATKAALAQPGEK